MSGNRCSVRLPTAPAPPLTPARQLRTRPRATARMLQNRPVDPLVRHDAEARGREIPRRAVALAEAGAAIDSHCVMSNTSVLQAIPTPGAVHNGYSSRPLCALLPPTNRWIVFYRLGHWPVFAAIRPGHDLPPLPDRRSTTLPARHALSRLAVLT